MQLDRKLQYDVLRALAEVYPDSLLVSNLPRFTNDRNFMGALFYLQEHGLITGGDIREPGQCRSMVDAQITRLGLDFIVDDGGLQAILGNYTINFYKDELVAIVDGALNKSGTIADRRDAIVADLDSMEPAAFKMIIGQYIAISVAGNHEQLSSLLKEGQN